MALHNTDSLVIETGSSDLTPTLPDPTTVSGRTHDLSSTGNATAVWGSTGATPFQVDGVAVASLSVARGTSVRVQSDGTHWVALRAPYGGRRVFAGTGTTDGSGNTTVSFSPAFTATPVVSTALQTSTTDVTDLRITALSTTSVTFQARRTPTTVVLGITVLGTTVALVGATVHVHAVEAGAV